MDSNETNTGMESIPQEILDGMNKDQLIKVIRLLENMGKGRRVLGALVCASIACLTLPPLVFKLGAAGLFIAPFCGLLALYVLDQTSVFFNRKKK